VQDLLGLRVTSLTLVQPVNAQPVSNKQLLIILIVIAMLDLTVAALLAHPRFRWGRRSPDPSRF